jgi:Domain of unknown function (DUF5753)
MRWSSWWEAACQRARRANSRYPRSVRAAPVGRTRLAVPDVAAPAAIFNQRVPGAWLDRRHGRLCGYAHSRAGFNNMDFWESNGPVHVWGVLDRIIAETRETMVLGMILLRLGWPGLLQTAEYARALFLAMQTDTSDDAINGLVAARMERQATLDQVDPPNVVALLDESVLHRLIGSPQVMHDALIHVANLSKSPNIVVQVVPASNGANAGLGGTFAIAGADGMPETLLMENVEDQTTEKRSLVRKATVTFDRVRADALPRDASRDLILKVADEKWKP